MRIISTIFALSLASSLHAQVFNAPPTQATPPPAASGDTTIVNQRQNDNANMFGDTLPFMNPGSETVSWNGQNWAVMDQRVFAARFEKYLNAPEAATAEDGAYRETISQILQKLSPHNSGGPDMPGAVALLPIAATHPIDARLCDSLASAIYAVYLSQKNSNGMNRLNEQLEKQRRNLEWNMEIGSEQRSLAAPSGKNGKRQKESEEELAIRLGRVGGYAKRIVEIEAMKQINRAKVEITAAKAKVEFQALLMQFMLQRRFEHVVIGCRLYRTLFADGDSELAIEKDSDVEKLFGQSLGVNPTIASLDAFANEAIRDVDEAVDAFRFLVEKQELASASKRLSEAFTIGEFLNKVRTLPRTEKRKVLAFVQQSTQLISALDVKDYTLADELVIAMRKAAKDFDYAKPLAAINTAKTVSDMQLSKAKNSMILGDQEAMAVAIKNATEVWPTNPKLKELGGMIDKGANVESQALIDLQGLIAQKNYRQIQRDQPRYILAVRNDPNKQEELRRIVEDVTKIDMTIVQAEKLAESGNKWAAWEIVERMYIEFPEDTDLNRKRADLSREVAPFVSALDQARELEGKKQAGSALSWFLKAKKVYPNSDYANEGIDRLIEVILPDSNSL
ncbi:MAG: hypothetical protein P8J87_17555 [Verrucomicrobiales bacterium]|nr:hypothetical protein [Verrucomicrobiales bacterium]